MFFLFFFLEIFLFIFSFSLGNFISRGRLKVEDSRVILHKYTICTYVLKMDKLCPRYYQWCFKINQSYRKYSMFVFILC